MKYYNDFGNWIRTVFPYRVQKISIDAGFSCPNRDGRISTGGCTYCDNRTFNPSYCHRSKTITEQLEDGKEFFARKYPDMKYLAYFQAYTNTYDTLEHLKAMYEEALKVPDVVGIVIGTRPDCVSDELSVNVLPPSRPVPRKFATELRNQLKRAQEEEFDLPF